MAFTHKYTEIYLETLKGKTNFLRASLALFVSFIALYKMFIIQYKVSTNLRNPNSNTGIRMSWTAKQLITKKRKSSGAPEPPNPHCG